MDLKVVFKEHAMQRSIFDTVFSKLCVWDHNSIFKKRFTCFTKTTESLFLFFSLSHLRTHPKIVASGLPGTRFYSNIN